MFNRRLIILFVLISLPCAVILGRLVQLQVLAHQKYIDRVEQIMIRPAVLLPAVRGRIFDRSGRLLADNKPCFNLAIHYGAISLDDEYIRQLAKNRARRDLALSRRPKESEWKPYVPQIESQIQNTWHQLPALIPLPDELGQPGLTEERALSARAKLLQDRRDDIIATVRRWRQHQETKLKKREQELQADTANWLQEAQLRAIRRQLASLVLREERSFIPVVFELDNDTARRIQTSLDSPEWLTVIPAAIRLYPYGYVACQTVGSVGPVRDFDSLYRDHPFKDPGTDDPYRGYSLQDDLVGLQGVERGYDWQVLRGSRGLQQKDRFGNFVEGGNIEPQAGKDLHLTIDIELQKDVELAMPGDSPGAAVVIDVASGDILALVSTPLDSRWDSRPPLRVAGDKPWLNRAVEGIYPPGSIVKPLVVLAALSEPNRRGDNGSHLINSQTIYTCPTSEFTQPSCGNHPHGPVGPRQAIQLSCNTFCAMIGAMLNLDMLTWFENAGLTRPTGLNLPREQSGTSPELTSGRFGVVGRLPPFEARQLAIGQGRLSVTPLQVANMMATIARRGVYRPARIAAEQQPSDAALDLHLDQADIDLIIDAMQAVVHEPGGTAYHISRLHETGLRIAGKTGTAQYGRQEDWRCWFAGFAPADKPRIAFAVLIEHGDSGARVAGSVAGELISVCAKHGYIRTAPTP